MIADEKKQEKFMDEFDEEMCIFEEEMKEWRKKFAENLQKYKWEINFDYDGKKGKFRGKGENGKPH